MIKSIKGKQLKLLASIFGGICVVTIAVLIFKSDNSSIDANASENRGVERYYEKTISTGVDGLSDKEMWIEKSTNELNE